MRFGIEGDDFAHKDVYAGLFKGHIAHGILFWVR
jgi:hypothetical protein